MSDAGRAGPLNFTTMKTSLLPLALAGLLACSASHAFTCEELRARIEARIAENGVSRFTVTTVDAAAPADGRVVGTCERGSKKIVYLQQAGSAGAPAAPAATTATAPRRDAILTECRDGTVSVGGNCRR
jgi:hypothetical protein